VVDLNILSVVGARPQFIKAAAVSRALRSAGGLHEIMLHTGQHFDHNMSAVFFEELEIPPPKINLAIHGGSHGAMTGRMIEALDIAIRQERPDRVLVYGDTNSTLAGALAAAKLKVPIIHVEAGLRSFNRTMPEEVNRVLTDHVSELLFAPTRTAVDNLARENIRRGVHHVGDVMQDAFHHASAKAASRSDILRRLGLRRDGYALVTIHRAENTESAERLVAVLDFVRQCAGSLPLILPLHPRTRAALAEHDLSTEGFTLSEPLGHVDMVALTAAAALVLTDSGGMQKEAYFARRPCITLRDETEWPETVAHGWNRLWTTACWLPRSDISDFGDGDAAMKIAAVIARDAL
jgi:UDP-GlcNAc3NAcA epimerase